MKWAWKALCVAITDSIVNTWCSLSQTHDHIGKVLSFTGTLHKWQFNVGDISGFGFFV